MNQLPEAQNNPGTDAQKKTQVLNLDQNLAGLLCYAPFAIGIVCSIVFVLTEPKTGKFVRFHAIQSLVLTAFGIGVNVVFGVLSFIHLGFISALLSPIFILVILAACIVCMIKAWKNEMYKLPVLGDIAAKYI